VHGAAGAYAARAAIAAKRAPFGVSIGAALAR
jgi:hypothetical protein